VSGKSAVSVNLSRLVCQQQLLILQAAAMDGNNEEALQFEWTSPLGSSPATYYRVKGVVAEQAMVSCQEFAALMPIFHLKSRCS